MHGGTECSGKTAAPGRGQPRGISSSAAVYHPEGPNRPQGQPVGKYMKRKAGQRPTPLPAFQNHPPCRLPSSKKVAQRWRIRLPMQGPRVRSLV